MSETALRNSRGVKFVIACLIAVMLPGMAFFSVQAFAGAFTLSSFRSVIASFHAGFAAQTDPDTISSPALSDTGAKSQDASAPGGHSMSGAEARGFMALPWIPAGYIRQAMTESSFAQSCKKFLRNFIIKDYPADPSAEVTDRTVRGMSNANCGDQIRVLSISRLTAG